jgi:hypothetical protein
MPTCAYGSLVLSIASNLQLVPIKSPIWIPGIHVRLARVTTEPPMNVDNVTPKQFEVAADRVTSNGYGLASYSLVTNLTKLIPSATSYPVYYPVRYFCRKP